jgi:hypothetical protein
MTLEEQLAQRVMETILAEVGKGNWLRLPHGGVEFPAATLREIYARIDMEKVKAQVVEQLEEMLATKIIHAMATELATDVKKILSNNELREDLRSQLRSKIRAAADNLA